MPIKTYSCKCGKVFDDLIGLQIVGGSEAPTCPECGSLDVAEKISGRGAIHAQGYDWRAPGEYEEALANVRDIESQAEKILSGEVTIREPKGMPSELRPQVPEHLKRRYY